MKTCTSPYRGLLAVKIAIVVVVDITAAINRYVLAPQMKMARDDSIRLLTLLTAFELILGACILAPVDTFGISVKFVRRPLDCPRPYVCLRTARNRITRCAVVPSISSKARIRLALRT